MIEKISTIVIALIHKNGMRLPIFNEEESNSFEDYFFGWMGLWSLCIAIGLILLVVGCSYLIDRNHKWAEKMANRYLSHAFIIVWLLGFVVYDIGMYTGEPWSLLGNAPMAIIHAFEMFILDGDISATHEPFHSNTLYLFGFSIVHFLAALVSLLFVLKHFGYSVIAAFKRRFGLSRKEKTFVFWGMNDAAYYLAKSIKDNPKDNPSYRIVVVRSNYDKNPDVSTNGMGRLFNFLSLKDGDYERIKELGCISTSTYSNLATIDAEPVEGKVLDGVLRLKSLCRIIKRKTEKELHLFFLSDNEDDNIQAVANLRGDHTIRAFAAKGKVRFYCHARYNSIHRVIEDELADKNIEIRIVDSAHLCVEQMKKKPELHPVNFVQVEKDATVSSPFNALVIGFGEVGIDVVRFLYEFGAFVKHKSWTGNVERSEFCCHVVDKNMNDLAGVFTANTPAIAYTMNRKETEVAQKINLYHLNCNSVAFYERLENWIKDLNYVVIATEDDETNISLAIRIFRLAIRNKEKAAFERFRIMVRIRHDENGHIQKIAHHYNRIWTANEASADEYHLHQNVIDSKDQSIESPITLFGSIEQAYTYDYIINDSLKEDAAKFKSRYDTAINEQWKKAGEETKEIISWDEEQKQMMQLTGEYEGFAPTYSGIMKLRRTQKQNFSNSLHKYTKILLARKALGDNAFNEMIEHGLVREDGCTVYSWREEANNDKEYLQRVLDVLAQTEHLRWNASHEILGYKKHGSEDFKDEARLLHGCLKEWEELSTRTQSYDYNIVDVSLEKESSPSMQSIKKR